MIRENSEVISLKDEALKQKDVLMSEIRQQLAAKEAKCRQKDEINRDKDEALWLKDECNYSSTASRDPAVERSAVSASTGELTHLLIIHSCSTSIYGCGSIVYSYAVTVDY